MRIPGDSSRRERLFADLTAEGLFTNAALMQGWSKTVAGPIGITEAMDALRAYLADVHEGDLTHVETMLYGQAAALNAIFAELVRRSGLNMGEYLEATDRYMRLALKAQAQCRATLETLAAIKNPPVVFARQANINNGGQQQVNNGASRPTPVPAAPHPAPAENPPTELLERTHGQRMDTRAARATGGSDPQLVPVGDLNRPTHS